jgi:hypothetical protein
MEGELSLLEGLSQISHKLAAKEATEHLHWQKKLLPTRDPAATVWRESTARDHTMQVRMMQSARTVP